MDRTVAAEKIRTALERRIARALDCKPQELPRLKLGTLVHFAFLLEGDQETVGGFHTSMSAVLQLVGFDATWDVEPKEETEDKAPEKNEVVN